MTPLKSTLRRMLLLVFGLTSLSLQGKTDQRVEKQIPSGQRLVLVLNQDSESGEAFRNEYFARNFPLAKAQGMYEVHSFKVDEVLSGERTPRAASFFAWPSPAISNAFSADPEYASKYAPRRKEGWVELQSVYMDLEAPVNMTLNPQKHYTVALLWLKDIDGYNRYFEATNALRATLQSRVLIKERVDKYDSVSAGPENPPTIALLIEWNDREGPAQYISSREFLAHRELHDSSLEKIEMYRLAFWE